MVEFIFLNIEGANPEGSKLNTFDNSIFHFIVKMFTREFVMNFEFLFVVINSLVKCHRKVRCCYFLVHK